MEQQQLFKGRDKRRKGWFWLDNDYLNGYAQFFGAIGTAIYVSLCRHSNNETQKCFPAQKLIAKENNIGERTVRQYIKIFEQYHIISIEREKDPITKKWLNNVYMLLDKTEWIKPSEPIIKKGKRTQRQPLPVVNDINQRQTTTNPEATTAKSQRQPLPIRNVDLYIKETNSKEAKQSFADNLNPLIEKFSKVNPSFSKLFANKTQRSAMARMVKSLGEEKLIQVLDVLPKTNEMKYAPVITTPLALENKLGDLIIFLKKENNTNNLIKL